MTTMNTAPGTPVVECQQLTKIFKDFWMRDRARAVDGISFKINRREIFGLLGPNGSGKSTTIKMILGLLRPTSGRVAVFGRPPNDVAIKARVGYLPEESYLYPFLNARETLDYYGKLFQLDHRTRVRRTDELLDMIGLAGAQFRPVREYSKGMQRRIGIAQALINDPDFLILDEPTTGLDPIGTRQIKDLIIELGRRGKTVLLSSHLLADVEDCVDRMVILYGGKRRAEGTCESLLESQHATSIEADTLDDETVAEIDRVIRARSGGTKTIHRVSRPRQKLEELFLKIVEQARAEQAQTSGATSGGQTASFLRAEPEQGEALIDRLVRTEATPITAAAPASGAAGTDSGSTSPAPRGVDDSVIGSLISGSGGNEPPPPPAPAPMPAAKSAPSPTPVRPAAPARPAATTPQGNVDQSVINSLLSGGTVAPGNTDHSEQGRVSPEAQPKPPAEPRP